MSLAFDLAGTFIRLDARGVAEPVELTPSFWRGSGRASQRWLGAVDFERAEDLHSTMREVHPRAEEVIYLISGAVDVLLTHDGVEQRVALEAGQAMIVPRGVWHRLVPRRPGRLLFLNSRAGMQAEEV